MTDFQTSDEAAGLLGGRNLSFVAVGSISRSGRALSAVFVDLDTGDVLSLMCVSGALDVSLLPLGDETREELRRAASGEDPPAGAAT